VGNDPKTKRENTPKRHESLRQRIKELLKGTDFDKSLDEIRRIPPKKVISPLLSFFYSGNLLVRWRAISCFGQVLSNLADSDMEAARIIMRRLMWSLNDESGGIGWGAPEAMGEAMACNQTLAEEYSLILLSYIREDGNFLEYTPLRIGALWGLARLCHARPDLGRRLAIRKYVTTYLKSDNPTERALAAWVLSAVGTRKECQDLKTLLGDRTHVTIFKDGDLKTFTVENFAKETINLW